EGWSAGRIEQVKASEERMDVKVQNAPQVRTVYLTSWVNGAGQVNFRSDVYDLDGTGFVVGQPLAPGEMSDDGQRYVLKAQVYKVEEVPDQPEAFSIFSPRRKGRAERTSFGNDDPFGFFKQRKTTRSKSNTFFFNQSNTDGKKKKSLADVDDDDNDGVLFNFNRPSSAKVKKKNYFDFKKKTTGKSKKKEAATAGKTKKKPVADANAKKKKTEKTAAAQKKPQPAAAVQPVKKKKKVEEASASAGPEFGQQKQ
ncbi:MAG: hypothetical protein AB7S59_23605, partial [Parvibaculaceae bacterium]